MAGGLRGSTTKFSQILETDRDNPGRNFQTFIPAAQPNFIPSGAGTWTYTRFAAGQFGMRRTAGASSQLYDLILAPLSLFAFNTQPDDLLDQGMGAVQRGIRISRINLIYSITVEAMDAHTAVLNTYNYVNEVAPAATSRPLTGALLTTVNAQPRNTPLTVTTPFVLGPGTLPVLTVTVNDTTGGGAVYDVHGAIVNWDLLL